MVKIDTHLKPPLYYQHHIMDPIIITLDGNIGAGKSTLLDALREKISRITVLQEPVGEWLTMKNEKGESLLSLFYKDTSRWCYTFQNCAILTRLIDTLKILKTFKSDVEKPRIIVTERSVLTDRHVFAEMLHKKGKMDALEWTLYNKWFDHFAAELPIKGIIHLATSADTAKTRIGIRGRAGEESIPLDYLEDLDEAHHAWIKSSTLPSLQITTEPGTNVDDVVKQVDDWIRATFEQHR